MNNFNAPNAWYFFIYNHIDTGFENVPGGRSPTLTHNSEHDQQTCSGLPSFEETKALRSMREKEEEPLQKSYSNPIDKFQRP